MPRDGVGYPTPRPYVGPATQAPSKALQAALRAYEPSLRRRLRQFAAVSRASADLLTSFPAAAFLIATAERGPAATGRAVRLVRDGAPLDAVGAALGLPRWMRRLPPRAFRGPIGPVDFSDAFGRRIGNFLPNGEADPAMWLDWVLEAERACDEEFALWIAGQPIFEGPPLAIEALAPLAAYAWASRQAATAGGDPFGGGPTKRWTPRRAFDSAVSLAGDWIRLVVRERCATRDARNGWLDPASVGGFKFEPLTTRDALKAEGEVMVNCLATYWKPVSRGECLVYAVRRGRRSVGSVEIRPGAAPGSALLAQLEGPRNGPPGDRVARAVEKWMRANGPLPLRGGALPPPCGFDGARWRKAAAAYVAARPAAPAFWSRADAGALEALDKALRLLAGVRQRYASRRCL